MIQRVQTLYLLLVTAMMAVMLLLPLGKFLVGDAEFILKAFGIFSPSTGDELVVRAPQMGILISMAAALPFITIFFYKNRLLQIRLCFMEMVFLLGVVIYVGFYYYNMKSGLVAAGQKVYMTFTLADLMPLVSLVMMWLAYKRIVKDEALVRSLDRIR